MRCSYKGDALPKPISDARQTSARTKATKSDARQAKQLRQDTRARLKAQGSEGTTARQGSRLKAALVAPTRLGVWQQLEARAATCIRAALGYEGQM